MQGGSVSLLNTTINNPLYKVFHGQLEKEKAAMFVCGGKLGECYLLQELIDSFLNDVEGEFRKEKWSRQTIKQNFRKCRKTLQDDMSLARMNSASGSAIMRSMSDEYADRLQPKLRDIVNGVTIDLMKRRVPNARMVAMWLVADLMFRMCEARYDHVIESMQKVVPAYYDSHYNHASCRAPYRFFDLALHEYDHRYLPMQVDGNELPSLTLGLSILANQFEMLDKDASIKEAVVEEVGRDLCDAKWDEALRKLQMVS